MFSGHAAQAMSAPCRAAYVPAGHLPHTVAFVGTWPAGHAKQLEPSRFAMKPGGQTLQAVPPKSSETRPGGQRAQRLGSTSPTNPGSQCSQPVASAFAEVFLKAAASRPAGQSWQSPSSAPRLGVDVRVVLTPPCIFCMENH